MHFGQDLAKLRVLFIVGKFVEDPSVVKFVAFAYYSSRPARRGLLASSLPLLSLFFYFLSDLRFKVNSKLLHHILVLQKPLWVLVFKVDR